MKADNIRKAALIEALLEKDRAKIAEIIAKDKPFELVILREGEPVPVNDGSKNYGYVELIQCDKKLATSEAEVDQTRTKPVRSGASGHRAPMELQPPNFEPDLD